MSVAVLDPVEVAIQRVELDIDNPLGAIRVQQAGLDWGDAAIQAFMADLRTGSVPLDYRIPNRTIKVPLGLGMDDSGLFEQARRALQAKVGLFQREGGWLKRQLRDGSHIFADVINATLTLPDKTGEAAGLEDNVVLQLECLPDFYGDEITLDAITGSGAFSGVLKQGGVQATILGDHPGRVRTGLQNNTANNQQGALWAFRSKAYDSAATAQFAYEAEAMTPLDVASVVAKTGASGGSVVKHANLTGGDWVPVLQTTLLSGGVDLTHRGTYRVLARVYSAQRTPALRLLWGTGDLAHPSINGQTVAQGAGDFYLVDLGTVRLQPTPLTTYYWRGVIQAQAVANGDDISIDKVMLQHVDEGAGWVQCATRQDQPVFGTSTGLAEPGTVDNDPSTGSQAWVDPGYATGLDFQVAWTALQGQYSQWMKATNFGFNIPSTATIVGIIAQIHRSSASGAVYDDAVRLVKAGAIQSGDRSQAGPWPAAGDYQWQSYGGQGDLWGQAWTPADINDAGFGVAFSAYSAGVWDFQPVAFDTALGGEKGYWVQSPDFPGISDIQMSVIYTLGAAFTPPVDAAIYGNRQAEIRTEGAYRQTVSGTAWDKIAQWGGDDPRIPPSGDEGRPVELAIRCSRGDGASAHPMQDPGLDSITAQVKYRPCYLFRP